MSKGNTPQTSKDAFNSLKASEMQQTYLDILSALDVLGRGTMEDIAAHLKCSRDKIWKRLSEMARLEMIYRPGTKKVLKSGRQGYEWMRTNPTTIQRPKPQHKEERQLHEFANDLITATNAIQTDLFGNKV